ncbi:MAG: phage gp6-like head-tail connector protein [Oscillospiraceae bacterium]|nr:phage gp6-like head-tail connector protein [Oscillospiraceae bacterium]
MNEEFLAQVRDYCGIIDGDFDLYINAAVEYMVRQTGFTDLSDRRAILAVAAITLDFYANRGTDLENKTTPNRMIDCLLWQLNMESRNDF